MESKNNKELFLSNQVQQEKLKNKLPKDILFRHLEKKLFNKSINNY
jgi:hypothetical protein